MHTEQDDDRVAATTKNTSGDKTAAGMPMGTVNVAPAYASKTASPVPTVEKVVPSLPIPTIHDHVAIDMTPSNNQ